MARTHGARNRSTVAREHARKVLNMGADCTPLDVLLAIMRSPEFPVSMRKDAAKDAAPYIHPRLQSVLHVDGRQQQTALGRLLDELDGQTRGLLSHEPDRPVDDDSGRGPDASD